MSTPARRIEKKEERILLRAAILSLALILCSCGKKPDPDPLDTVQYNDWKMGQVLRRLPAANFATTCTGRVEILAPDTRSKNPNDFCEIFVNGERVGKFKTAKQPDGSWPSNVFDVTFLTGPNTFDLWDSSSNRFYRESVDTRQCTKFQCAPTADGYEIKWLERKVPDLDK